MKKQVENEKIVKQKNEFGEFQFPVICYYSISKGKTDQKPAPGDECGVIVDMGQHGKGMVPIVEIQNWDEL